MKNKEVNDWEGKRIKNGSVEVMNGKAGTAVMNGKAGTAVMNGKGGNLKSGFCQTVSKRKKLKTFRHCIIHC